MGRLHGVLSVVVVMAVLSLVAGCSSTGQAIERTGRTVNNAAALKQDVLDAQQQMDVTMAALTSVVDAGSEGSLQERFKSFESQLDRLDQRADRVRSRRTDLQKRGNEYLTAWTEQAEKMQSEAMKERAAQRRAKLEAALRRISAEFDALAGAFEPLRSDLEDIKTFLANELTINGVKEAKPFVTEAREDAGLVKQRVTEALQQIDALSDFLAREAPEGAGDE